MIHSDHAETGCGLTAHAQIFTDAFSTAREQKQEEKLANTTCITYMYKKKIAYSRKT